MRRGRGGAAGARADRARRSPRSTKYLQTERALDLVPDDDAQVDAQGDESEEDEPEAEVCALRFSLAVTVGAAPSSMHLVRALDGDRIELERFVHHFRTAGRLGHERSLVSAQDLHGAMRSTFRGK